MVKLNHEVESDENTESTTELLSIRNDHVAHGSIKLYAMTALLNFNDSTGDRNILCTFTNT